MKNKIAGIYKILNVKTGDFYIGSSNNVSRRKIEHFSSLRNNKHYNTRLQRSFNKHGIEKFEFIIVAICPQNYLVKLEQWFLDNLKPKYNSAKNAINSKGHKSYKKIGEEKQKEIVQIDKDGNFIRTFPSAKVAKRELGFTDSNICNCCNYKKSHHKHYYWFYKEDYDRPDFKITDNPKIQIAIDKVKNRPESYKRWLEYYHRERSPYRKSNLKEQNLQTELSR